MTTRTTKRSPGEVTWMDLATPDLAVATEFYRQVFGWNYIDTGPDFGHYHMALMKGHNTAGMGPLQPGSPMPSAWTIYFSSDDAAADAGRAKALGGTVLVDGMVIGDSGTMAVCVDPTGAVSACGRRTTTSGRGAMESTVRWPGGRSTPGIPRLPVISTANSST